MRRALMLSSLLMPALVMAQQASAPTPTAPASSETPATTGTATTAAPAAAQQAKNPLANAVQARTPEEQANQSGFQFQVSLDNWLGTGTFFDPTKYAYLASNITIQPVYLMPFLGKRLVLSATFRGTYEYTMPDNEVGRRWSNMDVGFGASIPAAFRVFGLSFSPNVGLSVPSSLESIQARLITSLRAGLTVSGRQGPFDFRLAVSGTRGFYAQPFSAVPNPTYKEGSTQLVDPPRDASGNLLVVSRAGEPFSGWGGWNPAWGVSAGGSVQWRATGALMVYLGYTYIHTWREAATTVVDEYTPKALDANGNPVADVGYGRNDRSSAFVGASYQLNEHYSLDLGMSTLQTPLTLDNKRVRFPFFAADTTADSNTVFYFTLSAAY